MELTFSNVIDLIASHVFAGSTDMAALAILIAAWAMCAVICMNMRAPPTYSVVPMIPLAIFFNAYGILNTTVMMIIVIVASVIVAAEFKKVVD